MNDDNILVSIQCLVYNHEPYLRQCLDGFVMQKTNFRFEAIVHDDASTDGSAAIIREYSEKYPDIIKPIYEAENQYSKHGGFSALFDILNSACKGKYIAMCEGDDYWIDPMKLQKQVDFLESHPGYSMCFHKAKIVKDILSPSYLKVDFIKNRDYSGNELFSTWIVPTASMVCRRTVLNYKTSGDGRILNGDIVLILKCAETGKIRGLDDTMSVYRMQVHGVTYDSSLKEKRIKSYPKHLDFIRDNFPCISKSTLNKAYSNAYWQIFRLNNDFRFFFKSLFCCPQNVIIILIHYFLQNKK